MWNIVVGSRDGFSIPGICLHLANFFVPTGSSLLSTATFLQKRDQSIITAGSDGTEEVLIEGELRRLLKAYEVPKDLRVRICWLLLSRAGSNAPPMPIFLKKPRTKDPI